LRDNCGQCDETPVAAASAGAATAPADTAAHALRNATMRRVWIRRRLGGEAEPEALTMGDL